MYTYINSVDAHSDADNVMSGIEPSSEMTQNR